MIDVITIRVYNKYWETDRLVKMIRKLFGDIRTVIFCNGDTSRLDVDCEVVKVRGLKEEYLGAAYKSQPDCRIRGSRIREHGLGALKLVWASHQYCLENDLEVVVSTESDEWFVNRILLKRMELIKDYDVVMEKALWMNCLYPSTYIYKTSTAYIGSEKDVFDSYDKNPEVTIGRVLESKDCRIKSFPRRSKFGYSPNFGTVHHDSYGPWGIKPYLNYYSKVMNGN
jgi:hypothetical protein